MARFSGSIARWPTLIFLNMDQMTQLGIDSLSVNPASVIRTMAVVLDAETNPAKTAA